MNADLQGWFKGRPLWLQEAAKRLIQKTALTDKDITDLVQLCQQEASGTAQDPNFAFSASVFAASSTDSLRLSVIADVEGINLLAPRKPLDFGSENLVVIFGSNGSGKSGYVRILKHACGARCPGTLRGNIFSDFKPIQKCTITFVKGDEDQTCAWNASTGIVDELRCVDIFDASSGLVYLKEENEVTYEPPLLSYFSSLVSTCDRVSVELKSQIHALVSKKPTLPPNMTSTIAGKWYAGLSKDTKDSEVDERCVWDDDASKKLSELQLRLLEESPTTKAQNLRSQKRNLDRLLEDVESYLDRLSDKACQDIITLKIEADTKKKAAETAATTLFENTPLPGIGTNVWRELWKQARKYSEEYTYADKPFPVTEDDARCVLCQQELSLESRQRMISFQEFVKGEMQSEADRAQQTLNKAVDEADVLPSAVNLKMTIDAGGLGEEDAKHVEAIVENLRKRKEERLIVSSINDLTPLPDAKRWFVDAHERSNALESSATKYDEDAKGENRAELIAEKNELEARKWSSEQRKAAEDEIDCLRKVAALESTLRLTDTTALSRKKGSLADALITEAFADRFSMELSQLRASEVKIEVAKTRVDKGHVLHCLRWQDTESGSLVEVLSEGENRIVSLSAFLADVADKQNSGPFVFDDPISSLDQDFEEAVALRMVALSKNRQVIVFTHRLSLMSLLQEYGKKSGCEPHVVCIKRESWGAGEPGDMPIFAKKPDKALTVLLDERLPQARKVLNQEGKDGYYPLAKAICSDFRIILERMIENDLLADVVQRFRRSINTLGKLDKLARISDADCKFMDELMTKYSKYEHSQPQEAPVALPQPDELQKEMESLANWRKEFLKR